MKHLSFLFFLFSCGWPSARCIAFDKEDLEWMEFRNGAADFLEKGPGFDSVGIQVKVAVLQVGGSSRLLRTEAGKTLFLG